MSAHSRVADPDALAHALSRIVGDRMSRAESVLEQLGRGEGRREVHPPDVVVYPTGTDEVSAIVRVAASFDAPIIAYGAGSSLEGQIGRAHV